MHESIIRSIATEGIGALSVYGNKSAEAEVVGFLNHELIGVRRIAINTYLASGPDQTERVAFLKNSLPADQHYLIEQTVTDRKSVPTPPRVN